MNREEGNSLTVKGTTIKGGRVVWRWLFNQPTLGGVPAKLWPGMMSAMCSGQVDAIHHVIVDRANRYYTAGCPLDMCEYAAARDLWAAINQVDDPLSASVSKRDSQGPSRGKIPEQVAEPVSGSASLILTNRNNDD